VVWSVNCSRPTRSTRHRYVAIVCAVVIAPAVVLTVCDTGFGSIAMNVVHPNPSTTGTVAATDKLSAVPIYS